MNCMVMVRNNRTGYTKLMDKDKADRYVAGQAIIRGRVVKNATLKDKYSFA